MDPILITTLIGVSTLLIERLYSFSKKIKKSSCCGATVELSNSMDKDNKN